MKECAVSGCGRESFDKGLCRAHLIRQSRVDAGEDPVSVPSQVNVCIKCGAKRGMRGRGGSRGKSA